MKLKQLHAIFISILKQTNKHAQHTECTKRGSPDQETTGLLDPGIFCTRARRVECLTLHNQSVYHWSELDKRRTEYVKTHF